MQHKQFHIKAFIPTTRWPHGGYALYEIDGDDIARRVGFDRDGNVIRRDGWSGYVGTVTTLDQLQALISERMKHG